MNPSNLSRKSNPGVLFYVVKFNQVLTTDADLSKILGGQTKILGRKVVKGDECMGVSQLLGARSRVSP